LKSAALSDRFFFVTVRLLMGRRELSDADFRCLALAFNRARPMHPYFLTAWIFLPDPAAAGHAICVPSVSADHIGGVEVHQDEFTDLD
jgi:hypothetical protein